MVPVVGSSDRLPVFPADVPSETADVPSEAVSVPSEAAGVPSEAVDVPSEAVGVLSKTVCVPSEAVGGMSMASSHRLPVNFTAHSQWKLPGSLKHCPPFMQGLVAASHSLMSVSQLRPVYWVGQRHE